MQSNEEFMNKYNEIDVKEESLAYKLLCNACLCVGRKLHTIINEKIQKYYIDALDEIPVSLLHFLF